MEILISYYTRTGLTKKVAQIMAKKLSADTDCIHDKKERIGAGKYIAAGTDAALEKTTRIEYTLNPSGYDVVILGGPVWAFNISPALRTFIMKNLDVLKQKKILFFATEYNSGAAKKFNTMQQLLGIKPVSTMILDAKDFNDDKVLEKKIDKFIEVLKK